MELNKQMNETETEMRKVEDSLTGYKECKEFIDKLTEFRKIKKKQMLEISDSEKAVPQIQSDTEGKADFFLTQKGDENSSSISSSEKQSDFDEYSYERRIGFDKKKLLELFQDIEEK